MQIFSKLKNLEVSVTYTHSRFQEGYYFGLGPFFFLGQKSLSGNTISDE